MIMIRSERPSDMEAITRVTTTAFARARHASHTEQFIIEALRHARQLSVSLVAEDDGQIVGHVAVSPVSISSGATGWHGLGPISVAPERQRQGIGALLMQHALAALQQTGAAGCVVLGEPAYYERFGFVPAAPLVLPDVPPAYFLAISFTNHRPAGIVRYHAAFDATS